MLEEFKKFALRGNVVDLAIGVIIGAAFGAIVHVAGRRHHHAGDRARSPAGSTSRTTSCRSRPRSRPAPWWRQKSKVLYWLGVVFSPSPLTSSSSLLCCFWRSARINRLMRKEAEKAPPLSKQEQLLTEIRDLLKSR